MSDKTELVLPTILSKIFNNPVLNGVIGVSGFMLSIYFYFSSMKRALPAYAIVTNAVITSSTDSNNVKIFYKNKSVSNVKLMRAIVWNAGSNIIDKRDFIGDGLINIVPSKSVDVLDCKILKSSRPELHVGVDSAALNSNSIKVGIIGNEVFESKDGIIVQVLYSSVSSASWSVQARIRGLPEGFYQFESESNIFYNFYKQYNTLMLAIFIIPGLYVTYIMVMNRRNQEYVSSKRIAVIVFYWLLLIVFAFLPEPSIDTFIPESLKI